MTTWIALLRGINVGKAKRIAMGDLRSLLESIGYDDVRTVLMSGNCVFAARARSRASVAATIREAIDAKLGLDVKVIAMTASEFATVLDANPFVARKVDTKQLHVAFLSGEVPARKLETLDAAAFIPDEFEPGRRVIYARLPNGVMGSRLPDWEKTLGLTVTARNWATATRILAVAGG